MTIGNIRDLLGAVMLCGEDKLDVEFHSACGSDLMSDVLAFVKDQAVLLTGLVNPQVIRTAEMMDMRCVIFVRGKMPDEHTLRLARELGIALMSTQKRMYTACGILYANGLQGEGCES